jgi:RNase H-fold protein (predicted Holliday junction resolvase)
MSTVRLPSESSGTLQDHLVIFITKYYEDIFSKQEQHRTDQEYKTVKEGLQSIIQMFPQLSQSNFGQVKQAVNGLPFMKQYGANVEDKLAKEVLAAIRRVSAYPLEIVDERGNKAFADRGFLTRFLRLLSNMNADNTNGLWELDKKLQENKNLAEWSQAKKTIDSDWKDALIEYYERPYPLDSLQQVLTMFFDRSSINTPEEVAAIAQTMKLLIETESTYFTTVFHKNYEETRELSDDEKAEREKEKDAKWTDLRGLLNNMILDVRSNSIKDTITAYIQRLELDDRMTKIENFKETAKSEKEEAKQYLRHMFLAPAYSQKRSLLLTTYLSNDGSGASYRDERIDEAIDIFYDKIQDALKWYYSS